MCVPESALYYYELELEQEYEAHEHGYDSYEEYINDLRDYEENLAYDSWKDEQLTD